MEREDDNGTSSTFCVTLFAQWAQGGEGGGGGGHGGEAAGEHRKSR